MEPFYFDASGAELLGIYHPATDPGARRAVVLCPAFGNEIARTYQATRVLAQRWTEKAHVLRFDYSGTGDSFGEWNEAGPERWLEDIKSAVGELTEISGAEKIVLAGIRFGALLVARAASDTGASELVLWDPVTRGDQYRKELDAMHQGLIDSHINLTAAERAQSRSELCGFELAPWMETELPSIEMPANLPAHVESVTIVQTIGQSNADALAAAWASDTRAIDCRSVDFDCAWNLDPEAILNPSPVIEELVQCL